MSARLDGKVVLVTRAALPIGAALARMAAERGAHVVVGDPDRQQAETLAARTGGLGLRLQVTEEGDWDDVMKQVVARHGRLDGLLLCGEPEEMPPLADMDLAAFQMLSRTEVEGTFLGLQRGAAQMRRQAGGDPAHGSMVLITPAGPLSITGAAAAHMAKAVGVELGRKGDFIRVNSIMPDAGARAEDVAEAAVFHLSDEASFITAAQLPVGGRIA